MPREYPLERYRNIGIMAHIDAGKTTTTERILFYAGAIHRMGNVDEGNTTTDWMIQEKQRGITIQSAAISAAWSREGEKYNINLIDTPGHVDFTVEVERSLRALDGAIAVFDGGNGVEPQSETVWRQADRYGVPRICFINKLDRVGADFEMSVQSIKDKLGAKAVPVQIPYGIEDRLRGVIDLIQMKAVVFPESDQGSKPELHEIPEDLRAAAERMRTELVETAAEQDDALTERYLETGELSNEEIRRGLRKGCLALQIFPVLCGSSFRHKGVQPLLDAVVDYLPSPLDIPPVHGKTPDGEDTERATDDEAPFSALVFKVMNDPAFPAQTLTFMRVYSGTLAAGTTAWNPAKGKRERVSRLVKMRADKKDELTEVRAGDICAAVGMKLAVTGDTLCDADAPIVLERMEFPEPVIDIAIEPKSTADQDKLAESLQRLASEDPSFRVRTSDETGQTIIAGMGELHLEIIVDRLLREFNVDANVGKPRVAYRETLGASVEEEGKYIRQTGGKGMYGHIVLRVSPNERGKGFEFRDLVTGGKVPKEFVAAAGKGAEDGMSTGPLAGYPLVDVVVEAIDGSVHEVDSSELAFRIAGSMAFKEAVRRAQPILLEPIMRCEITVPEANMGAVQGDLNARRGRINGMEPRPGSVQALTVDVPLGEMFGYATDLRSRTQGRGTYTMQFDHYDQVSQAVYDRIVAH